jgi:phage tail sheath protein FI
MPVTPTYPGVYIEELPSGVRTIAGVATSIAAFVGWAPRGPVDRALMVQSWQDFEREFGGLDVRSLLGYSVYHFFNNGGQQAYVVRLVADDAQAASVTLSASLKLEARNPGAWANDYGVMTKTRADDATRFSLAIVYAPTSATDETVVESFSNLSMLEGDSRNVAKILEAQSRLVTAEVLGGTTPPANTGTPSPKFSDPCGADGAVLEPNATDFEGKLAPTSGEGGLYLLDRVDLFNLLCVPGETTTTVISSLQKYCRDHRAFLIADCDQEASYSGLSGGPDSNITGDNSINSAFYFPWLKAPDLKRGGALGEFPPCGFAAGLYAKTDSTRGLWKAPAGTDASLVGVDGVRTTLTDLENGEVNIRAINCIRKFSVYGTVLWGARTLRGNNEIGSEWKYIPVRRMALFIEESLYRGTKWVVFEPNDEPLWAQIRLNIGSFMHGLFRKGAFQGSTPKDAYFVKCDKETTTQDDINRGVVNILVGFAPLKPAEFVIIQIQQMAGQVQA